MADLEQFSEEGGRYGSRVWDVWKIRRGSSHRRSTNTQDPLPDPYPLKTIPLKCPDLVMLPLLGPLQPGSIRLQFRGCLTPIHANEDISPMKKRIIMFHVVLLIMTSCMRRARREWLDAICRLIIWSTLSSQTSIPRDPLTATVQLLQGGSTMSHLTSYYYCRHTRS